MTNQFKAFAHPTDNEPDRHRFAGVFAIAKKHKPRGDVHIPKGHNREHAWILWSKIQRGQIRTPATVAAIRAEYGELFKEFAAQTGTQAA